MKKLGFVFLVLSLLGVRLFQGAIDAAETVDITLLARRIEALELEVRTLKERLEIRKEEPAAPAPEMPVVTASSKDGFSIKSPDDAFKLKMTGYLQTDARLFTDNDKTAAASGTTDAFLMRRVRPAFEGTLYEVFDFKIIPSFDQGSAALQDAYLEYRNRPELKIRVGKFKTPFGLERLKSNATTAFVETAHPTSLTPNYDEGFQVSGDIREGVVHYAVALANGTADSASVDTDVNNDKEVAARLLVSPFKLLGPEILKGFSAGAAATYGHKEGASLPTLRSPGQASIFSYNSSVVADGPHTRFSPQGSWVYRQWGLVYEYVSSDQSLSRGAFEDKFRNTAWQVTGSYLITGEEATSKGIVTPLKPFDPAAGSWGAWEIVGRYHELALDDKIFEKYSNNVFANANTAVSGAESWGIGINGYLNRNLKLQIDYEHTEFSGGASPEDLADRPDEDVVLSRFQLAY